PPQIYPLSLHDALPIYGVQQPANESQALLLRQFAAWRGEEPSPKRPRRPLIAAAEQRPAHPSLVVLGMREGQGHEDNKPFVWQLDRKSTRLNSSHVSIS